MRGVAGSFAKQLEELMGMLELTTPHYVRCVKPNGKQSAGLVEDGFVLSQLRCGGTPQLLQLMGRGYPTRCEYEQIAARYQPYLPVLAASLSARDFAQALLATLELTESVNGHHADYALGVRRVFFSAGKMATLDALMGGSEAEMAALAARVTRWVARRRYRPHRAGCQCPARPVAPLHAQACCGVPLVAVCGGRHADPGAISATRASVCLRAAQRDRS